MPKFEKYLLFVECGNALRDDDAMTVCSMKLAVQAKSVESGRQPCVLLDSSS